MRLHLARVDHDPRVGDADWCARLLRLQLPLLYYDPIIDRLRTGDLQRAHSSHPRLGRLWSALRGRPTGPTSPSGVCPPGAVRCHRRHPPRPTRRGCPARRRRGLGLSDRRRDTGVASTRSPVAPHAASHERARPPHAHTCGAAFGMRGVSGMPRVSGRARAHGGAGEGGKRGGMHSILCARGTYNRSEKP